MAVGAGDRALDGQAAGGEPESQRDEEPLALPNGATGGAAVRGRLTVRQRPWLHPAGVEVRLTRSWLDTVAEQ